MYTLGYSMLCFRIFSNVALILLLVNFICFGFMVLVLRILMLVLVFMLVSPWFFDLPYNFPVRRRKYEVPVFVCLSVYSKNISRKSKSLVRSFRTSVKLMHCCVELRMVKLCCISQKIVIATAI